MERKISTDYIIQLVSNCTGVSVENIKSEKREKNFKSARHIVCYLASKLETDSLVDIGKKLGGRHHTTILHGRDNIREKLVANNYYIKNVVDKILSQLTEEKTDIIPANKPQTLMLNPDFIDNVKKLDYWGYHVFYSLSEGWCYISYKKERFKITPETTNQELNSILSKIKPL